MTDQEHKIEIINKHFNAACLKHDKIPPDEEEFKELIKGDGLLEFITSCMEEWAGVILSRVEESDQSDEEFNAKFR